MESAPKNQETAEITSDYQERLQSGTARAEELIRSIDGFEKLDYRGQYAALHELLNKAYNEGETYFVIEHIAVRMKEIELTIESGKIDAELQKIREYYQTQMANEIEISQQNMAA